MDVTRFRRESGAPPFVYGHRGVRGEAPENTMAAFELARKYGVQGVELDVRPCRSGEVVVIHDPTLARSTGGRDARAVADLDFRSLREIDVGAGERVPLLGDVLDWARASSLCVNVEIKRDVPDRKSAVRATAGVVRAYLAGGDVIVSSFDPWMLAYFGWILPAAPRGSLFSSDSTFERLQTSGRVASLIGAVAVHPERKLVVPERCRKWKKRRKLINVWTVNDVAEARALAAMGVDAIITDVPGVMVPALR
jgi:glycerophosphoryl diester phosphodiesterase